MICGICIGIMKTIEVVAAVIRKDDKIFATQRGYGEWKDWWEFPGGKMEPGETPEEALKREIREELSSEISVDDFLCTVEYDYPKFHLTMHCYICSLQSESLHLNEHEAARWLKTKDLDSVKWLPADIQVLESIKNYYHHKNTIYERPITTQQRHANMAAIHSKDTKPEMVVRKWLWGRGYRYRLNHPRLPGKPDIVMLKYRTCIFVNGCFWHGHNVALPQVNGEKLIVNSECCKIPKTNRDFWVAKIRRNQERDKAVKQQLASMGWHSIVIWECELKPKVRERTLESLTYTLNKIFLQDRSPKRYDTPEDAPAMAAEDIT